jgi:RND family efflux transporter MFP subunit
MISMKVYAVTLRSFIVIVLGCGIVSCTQDDTALPNVGLVSINDLGTDNDVPVSVQTTQPELVNVSQPITVSGTIAAKQTSNIGALADGVVDRIFVVVGDRVQKGDRLFQTRQVDYRRRVDEAQANLAIATAKSMNAEKLRQRYANLIESEAVSRVDFEEVETQALVAEAEVTLRQAQLQTAKQMLQDTIVRAPFNGAITARYIDEGVFMANRFSGMGNSSVVQVRECEIAAAILFAPESKIGSLAIGMEGRLYVDGASEPIPANIMILNDSVDPQTRTVELRMPFVNKGCAVKAGQSVRAEITAPERPALVMPRQAIHEGSGSAYVYRVQNGRTVRQPVTFRDLNVDRVEVLTGLESTDVVALDSSQTLRDGMEVITENS